MIEDLTQFIPDDLLEESGSVFYSGRNAFRSTFPLYILGLNPGGSPERQASETIAWHTNKVLEIVPDDWSAYRDESWCGAMPGTYRMQPRVLHLMNQLGMSAGDVPASNVVFLRSQRERAIKTEFQALADSCWQFHQAAIEQLQPRVILCFGRTAGKYVRDRLRAHQQVGEFVEANNRKWRSRSYRNPSGVAIVVATHPSIADWTAPATDPSPLVMELLAQVAAESIPVARPAMRDG